MSSSKTIVKEIVNKDIQRRVEPSTSIPAGAGRKVGEETHIEITPERIRVRAYEIFQARNGGPGDADSDWAQAERELNGHASSEPSSEDTLADPTVLEIRTRSQAQREPTAHARGRM